jgi:hypothetical protein
MNNGVVDHYMLSGDKIKPVVHKEPGRWRLVSKGNYYGIERIQ